MLGRANYAQTGLYGKAFFDLSIGFERTAKLIYIADYAIEHQGQMPTNDDLKNVIGHDLKRLFLHAESISTRRRQSKRYSQRPDHAIHRGIIDCLSEFARRARYYNLDLITSSKKMEPEADPMTAWDMLVTERVIEVHCSTKKRAEIEGEARLNDELYGHATFVRMTSESGEMMNTLYQAALRTGLTDVARKWTPLYVLQIMRWLTYLISDLAHEGAYTYHIDAVLGMEEHFGKFMNDDRYFKTRKKWSQ